MVEIYSCKLAPIAFLAALFGSAPSCSASANQECKERNISDFFGEYAVINVENYGGGLTTKHAANERKGSKVEFWSDEFLSLGREIKHPEYKIICDRIGKEGEVSKIRWSNFYGFGLKKNYVEAIEVYENGAAEPYLRLEIVDGQLWEMFDGWLYQMRPTNKGAE